MDEVFQKLSHLANEHLSLAADLKKQLEQEKELRNAVYKERNLILALLVNYLKGGLTSDHIGIKEHVGEDWDDEWRHVLFIDLPHGGQVSWHLYKDELVNFPGIGEYKGEWDGHDTEEKYRRVRAFLHCDWE
jgi:hypothetical protein